MFIRLKNFEGAAALLAAAFIYATFGLLIREISKMLSVGAQTTVRFALAAAIAGVVYLLVRKKARLSTREWWLTIALGVVFGIVVLLFTLAVTNTTIANSVFLLYAGSILSSFLVGTIVFKEKVTGIKLVAIAIGIVGLGMYSQTFLALSIGVIAAFASGLFDGVANGLRKKLKGIDRNLVISSSYAVAAVLALGVTILLGGQWLYEISWTSITTVVVFAILLVFLSNLLLFGFQHFDVNVGTVILASELFFATLLGYIFFREQPTANELIGGVLIFAASIIASVDFGSFGRKKPAVT
jgi:drug/metabolite transporter (DMT)-like permease